MSCARLQLRFGLVLGVCGRVEGWQAGSSVGARQDQQGSTSRRKRGRGRQGAAIVIISAQRRAAGRRNRACALNITHGKERRRRGRRCLHRQLFFIFRGGPPQASARKGHPESRWREGGSARRQAEAARQTGMSGIPRRRGTCFLRAGGAVSGALARSSRFCGPRPGADGAGNGTAAGPGRRPLPTGGSRLAA